MEELKIIESTIDLENLDLREYYSAVTCNHDYFTQNPIDAIMNGTLTNEDELTIAGFWRESAMMDENQEDSIFIWSKERMEIPDSLDDYEDKLEDLASQTGGYPDITNWKWIMFHWGKYYILQISFYES